MQNVYNINNAALACAVPIAEGDEQLAVFEFKVNGKTIKDYNDNVTS